jgi:hypothetical protein
MKILRRNVVMLSGLLIVMWGAGAAVTPVAMGGTINGTVHDELSQPLENADVNLYRAEGSGWSFYDDISTDEFGDFDFGDVTDGTYYVRTYPRRDKYISEYYDDVFEYDDKAELVVTSGSDHFLDIALASKWLYLEDLDVYPQLMLHEGSDVYVYGTAVNDTGLELDIYYWVSLDVDFEIDYGGRLYNEYGEWTFLGPERVTLPPGETPFVFPIRLSTEAQSDVWYDVTIYVALGHPSVPVFETYAGNFQKLAGR